MSSTTEVRVLPADVYDALEVSAAIHGGIGAFSVVKHGVPCCVHGHAAELAGVKAIRGSSSLGTRFGDALRAVGIGVCASDDAVCDINERRVVLPCDRRVTFAEWCAELSVVRGES